jgi:hypothetical protein
VKIGLILSLTLSFFFKKLAEYWTGVIAGELYDA